MNDNELKKLKKSLGKAKHLTQEEKEFWELMIFDYEYLPIIMKRLGNVK